MERTDATDQTVIIVVQYEARGHTLTMGILVDEVVEVLDVPADRIEPSPTVDRNDGSTDFILGIGKSDKRVIFLLDISQVLGMDEASPPAGQPS